MRTNSTKLFFAKFGWVFVFALLLGAMKPAHAVYPAPWPDSGNSNVNTGWHAYTQLGVPIGDPPSASDNSTGGTTPTQAADFITGTLPSFYTGYDSVNQVLFIRMRLASSPLTPTPNGASNDDPFGNVTWSLLIDTNGDGFKDFLVRLNGDIGGPSNAIDDLAVYYDSSRSQGLAVGATPVWVVDAMNPAASPVDADARADVYDFRYTRGFDGTTLPVVGYFLDFQVPLSAFTVSVGGTQIITPSTSVAFAFGTSNSNTNPFQKDAGYNGTFTADILQPFPFGDPGTPAGGTSQNPRITSLAASGTCGTEQLDATVMDTLTVLGGQAASTVSNVKFYYQPDSDNNGVPDGSTTPTLIGIDSTAETVDPTHWSIAWNNTAPPAPANGQYVIFAVATDQQGNTGTSAYVPFTQSCGGVSVSGKVYGDANHNSLLDGAETGTSVASLFVKLKLDSSSSASAAATVDLTTGVYSFTAISAGAYSLILDNNSTLSDVTPFLPANYIGTQAPTQIISGVVVSTTSLANQNFGLFNGSKVSGAIFLDTGFGGGIANNGVRDGTEGPLSGLLVRLTNAAGTTTYDSMSTDVAGAYTLWISAANAVQSLHVAATNAVSTLSTGASVGNSAGTYNRATDVISFTGGAGTVYSGLNFGDVPINQFTLDNAQVAAAGSLVEYPHAFTAGSGGSVTFTTAHTPNPANPNWSNIIYRDLNGNGALDPGELPVGGAITVTAGSVIYLLVQESIPAAAGYGDQDDIIITANFSYTNAAPTLSASLTHRDLTTVGTPGDRLQLIKSVDKTEAKPGETVTYTIIYRNVTTEALGNLVVSDDTPPFTNFLSASNGVLPASLTGVTVTSPAIGATGTVLWTFTGTLAVGSSGTVTLLVRVQ